MNKPLVSVILPVYNGEKYLGRCLFSIFAQTFKNFELIIIDDGSTDRTVEILKPYRNYRSTENEGLSKALNRGINFAQGEYVCFIAHDDWWAPHKLKTELQYIDEYDVGVVYSDFYDVNEANMVGEVCKVQEHSPLLLRTHNYVNIGASMIRIKHLNTLLKLDGHVFDESLVSCMDGDLWIRLSSICDFKHIPQPLAYYFRHEGQLSKTPEHAEARERVYG